MVGVDVARHAVQHVAVLFNGGDEGESFLVPDVPVELAALKHLGQEGDRSVVLHDGRTDACVACVCEDVEGHICAWRCKWYSGDDGITECVKGCLLVCRPRELYSGLTEGLRNLSEPFDVFPEVPCKPKVAQHLLGGGRGGPVADGIDLGGVKRDGVVADLMS